jgi:hypothetical protein
VCAPRLTPAPIPMRLLAVLWAPGARKALSLRLFPLAIHSSMLLAPAPSPLRRAARTHLRSPLMRAIAQLIGRNKCRVLECAQRCRGRSSTYHMLPLATLVHSTHCSNERKDVAQIGLHESTTHARAGSVVVVVATVTLVAAVSLAAMCAAAKHHCAAAHLCKREGTPCMHRALVRSVKYS